MNRSAWFLRADGSAAADWPSLWSEACRRYGPLPAVIQREGVLTYQELDQLSDTVADSLRMGSGWQAGQAVPLEADPESFFVPLLGVWKAGGVAIPKPPADHSSRDTEALGDSIRVLTRAGQVVSGDGMGQAIYFTSGSTGKPRAVLRGWRQALFEAGRYSELIGLREGMEATMLIAPWFGASTKHLLGCLLSGVLQRFGHEFPRDSDLLHATPAHLSTLAKIPGRRTRYRWISLTGESIHTEARAAIQRLATPDGQVLNALGGTEFGVVLNQVFPAGTPPGDLVGQPPDGKTVVLLDDNGAPVSKDEAGRLFVESRFVAEGYLDVDGGTVQAVPFRPESTPLPRLPTGDLALAETAGIRLLGRANAWIKHQGRWVDATPLRRALEGIPGLRSHFLQAGGSANGLEVWIEIDHPDTGTLERVAENLRRTLVATPLMPTVLHGVERFPRNRHGKLDLLAFRSGSPTTQPGGTTLVLQPIWERLADALLRGNPSPQESPGPAPRLDSLALENLALELERRTGRTLTARSLVQTLFQDSFKAAFHGDWLRLGDPNAEIHLFWFGDPLLSLRSALPGSVTVWQVEPESLVGPGLATSTIRVEDLATRCLSQIPKSPGEARIWFGGFSLGAWMAHEAALQGAKEKLPIQGALLVDPPRLRLDPFRRLLRGTRSAGFRALGQILRALDRSDSDLARRLHPKLSKEARRGALLRYRPSASGLPTWLFHGDRHGLDTVPLLRARVSQLTAVSLGTRSHVAPVQDSAIREAWIRPVQELMNRSRSRNKRTDDRRGDISHV